MRTVKIDRSELLEIVQKNKQKHVTEYAEAVTDYKKAVLKIAQDNLKLARSGDLDRIAQIRNNLAKPTSFEDSYTMAIRMLELSVDEVIELTQEEFSQLVLDEWHWKNLFITSNALYKTI
jgi:uncharacterized beta-barrel protein YwiB (DUF1934 family)